MNNLKLLKCAAIDFLDTLHKELRLSICIDKIYYNCDYSSNILDDKICNIINGYEDDELEENSTIVKNVSGEKLCNLNKVYNYLDMQENLKDKAKINKIKKEIDNIMKKTVCSVKDIRLTINNIKQICK